jgi:Holliday junction resolvase RusA-like endonuclease
MVGWYCKIAMLKHNIPMFIGPVALGVMAYFPYPGSGKPENTYKSSKPDLNNIIKTIEDALNKIAWKDDSQVAKYLESDKLFSPEAGPGYALVTIRSL